MLLLLAGCAPRVEPPALTWDFEAPRPALSEIRVLPVLAAPERVAVSEAAWVAELPSSRLPARVERTAQLARVPAAIGLAVPGALGAMLGPQWDGRFRAAEWPPGARARLRAALAGRGDLEGALAAAGAQSGGDACLVVWVDDVVGAPVNAQGPPGEVVTTGVGPVLVDAGAEPYVVSARVGVALVAADGEILVRYLDRYEAILSAHRDPASVGRAVARAVAAEVAWVWPGPEPVDLAEAAPF